VNLEDVARPWVKKVYGPYTRKDGRKHVILYDGIKRRTVSYPKWLVEQSLGRILGPGETVDHKDRDFTNDALDNLQVMTRSRHTAIDARRVKPIVALCIKCGEESKRKANNTDANAKKGRAGPFCKRCAGKYGADLQNNKTDKLNPQDRIPVVSREYYLIDK